MDELRCPFPSTPEALVLGLALEMLERTHTRLVPA
jgi:hypothetical protein